MPKDDASTTFIDALTKSPQLKVLTILAEHPDDELTKTEIANKAGIGRTTLYRVWSDLEKMKAITPSRQVGAVTLYRINEGSPVVRSVLNITQSLSSVRKAVSKIEEIQSIEKTAKEAFGKDVPPGPNVLLKLYEAKSEGGDRAVDVKALELTPEENEALSALIQTGFVLKNEKGCFLTSYGSIAAKGAAQMWRKTGEDSMEDVMVSARQALNLIDQEIKKIHGKLLNRR